MAARLIGIACVAMGALLFWAALGSSTPQAYLFPKILALVMVALGLVMVVRAFSNFGVPAVSLGYIPWHKILPGVVVLVAFLSILETVGFYLSSWLAFSTIGILYAPTGHRSATAKWLLPISIIFLGVLYLIFWMLLQVQLPRGFAF